eukprot:CAMPEP_0172052358 /NCGR_PEP_ID=MMETSP1043-20130122/3618_1 /TAXON_ID=464988 /ORGANISM="Hemiselmis andersenii, Strain CCMP441" /LENGTH=231 /DNA_ID=CAMNT_0012711511 /DNA_START=69 /DNA_END=760 /DNA_ORIENTATION=-
MHGVPAQGLRQGRIGHGGGLLLVAAVLASQLLTCASEGCEPGSRWHTGRLECVPQCELRLGLLSWNGASALRHVPASMHMAIHDVNSRNGTLAPALASIALDANVTWTYKDTQGDPVVAMQQVLEWNSGSSSIGALVGPARSAVSAAVSTIASLFAIPLVSFWSVSPLLGNKIDHPFFSRTIPSSTLVTDSLPPIWTAFGWRKVGVIFVDDLWGRSFNIEVGTLAAIGGFL